MEPKIKQISETFFEVGTNTVKIQTRSGRVLLLCSCTNHQKFCKENPFCFHKQKVIEFLTTKDLKESAKQIKEEIKTFKKLKLNISKEMYEDYTDRLINSILKN